jgi:hypothetical protein
MSRCWLLILLLFPLLSHSNPRRKADCGPAIDSFLKQPGARLRASDVPVGTTVWHNWSCGSCSRVNSARPNANGKVACGGCGKPREDERFFWASGTEGVARSEDLAHDARELRRAQSGAKWTCGHCNTSHFGTEAACAGCGAPRDGIAGTFSAVTTTEALGVEIQSQAGIDLATRSRPKPRRAPEARVRRPNRAPILIGGAVAATAAVGTGVWWALQTREYSGRVTRLSWEHAVVVEEFRRVTKRDWRHRLRESDPVMPIRGSGESPGCINMRNCKDEYFETVQDPCGVESYQDTEYRTETYTDYETDWEDNGNGSSTAVRRAVTRTRRVPYTVTKTRIRYCPRRVYRERCDFDTFEWTSIRTERKSGTDPESELDGEALPWPQVVVGELQRGLRRADYRVHIVFDYKDKELEHHLSPGSEEEFLSWSMGTQVVVEVFNAGAVKEVRRLDAPPAR